MTLGKRIKNIAILLTPLLLFFILFVPYGWLNGHWLVDWLGCGCPAVDEFGNDIHPDFNANDFTALFWLLVSACATVMACFLSRRIPKEKRLFRILYVIGMLGISLLISSHFYRVMMWC